MIASTSQRDRLAAGAQLAADARELVLGHASERVALTQGGAQAAGDRRKHLGAGLVAERFDDRSEAVDVDHDVATRACV